MQRRPERDRRIGGQVELDRPVDPVDRGLDPQRAGTRQDEIDVPFQAAFAPIGQADLMGAEIEVGGTVRRARQRDRQGYPAKLARPAATTTGRRLLSPTKS